MQHSSKPFSRFLAIPLLAGIAVLGVAGSQPAPPDPVDPELREIIERALERAAWAEEEDFETRYRCAMTQRVQRFDGDGEVTDHETLLYQVEPYQGALFSRLMARDGEPIDARGRREQERRWEVSFEPRPGKLPVRRRIDHALNRSRGEVWIDTETYEIAQISFQLMDRVRLWWGIIGSISDATGRLERRPVADDVWLDTEFEVYFHVRVLFRTTRRNTTTQWSEFELAD